MTEKEALILSNLLNGVAVDDVAASAGEEVAQVMGVFQEAMRRVAEYVLVHCVAFFPCTALSDARRNRVQVLEILSAIERWDAYEHEIVGKILRGKNVMSEGVPREDAERILNATLNALPNYLRKEDLPQYNHDRRAFVRNNRSRVLDAVDRFVSFRNPLLYKNIEHTTLSQGS